MAVLTVDFRKHRGPTPASGWHGSPNHYWLETSHWTSSNMDSVPLHSSSRLWDLDFTWNAKFNLIWKEEFGPLWNSPVIFSLTQVRCFWRCLYFRSGLGSPFPEDVWVWCLLMHWLQLQFTPCEALPSVWIGFVWQYSQACGHPCCLCTFSDPISFLPVNFAFNMLWYSTPWTATLQYDPLWLTLFVEVSKIVFWTIVKRNSVPHYCGFKEQEIPTTYTVWMVIYWNSNVNILIFWDTDFWLSWAVSSNHQN